MSHAEICPVCRGAGHCYGCDNKGWVTVYDREDEEIRHESHGRFRRKSDRCGGGGGKEE